MYWMETCAKRLENVYPTPSKGCSNIVTCNGNEKSVWCVRVCVCVQSYISIWRCLCKNEAIGQKFQTTQFTQHAHNEDEWLSQWGFSHTHLWIMVDRKNRKISSIHLDSLSFSFSRLFIVLFLRGGFSLEAPDSYGYAIACFAANMPKLREILW